VFDEYFFLLVQGLDATTKGIDFNTIQLALFVSDRFLLTHRKVESVSTDKAWAEARNGASDITLGPAHFAYWIVRHVTDRYTHLVEGIEQELEQMEDEMFENPRDALLGDLLSYGRNLKRLRRIFNYHQGLFTQLSRKDHPFIGKRERHEFNDAFEHTERLSTLTSLFGEVVNDLMNGYISVTGHRLNQIIRVLTIVTVVFLPLTLLVGIYGMNFDNMPELHYKDAYFLLLGVMGTIVISLVLVFRKLKGV
jgi:magnesium transporter